MYDCTTREAVILDRDSLMIQGRALEWKSRINLDSGSGDSTREAL